MRSHWTVPVEEKALAVAKWYPWGRQVRGSGSHPQVTAARSHVRRRHGNRSLARTSLPSSEKPGIRVPPYRFFGLAKDYRPQAGSLARSRNEKAIPWATQTSPRRSPASLGQQCSNTGTEAQKKSRLPTAHGPRTRGESLIPLKQDVRGRYPQIRNANLTSARGPLQPAYRTPSETPSFRQHTNRLRAAQPARTPCCWHSLPIRTLGNPLLLHLLLRIQSQVRSRGTPK